MQGSHDVGVIIGQFWNGVDIPPQECKDTLPGSAKTKLPAAKKSKDAFTDGSTDLGSRSQFASLPVNAGSATLQRHWHDGCSTRRRPESVPATGVLGVPVQAAERVPLGSGRPDSFRSAAPPAGLRSAHHVTAISGVHQRASRR